MSRWRPPTTKALPYITPQGYANLEKELAQLWGKRRIVNDALAAAAAEGDRSENAEYIYRKKEQAGIDRRIRYLQKRMPDLKIIDKIADKTRIYFGAYIKVETQEGTTQQYRIVGADEIDLCNQHISIDSPLAKALLKKQVGDETSLEVDNDTKGYSILSIWYD